MIGEKKKEKRKNAKAKEQQRERSKKNKIKQSHVGKKIDSAGWIHKNDIEIFVKHLRDNYYNYYYYHNCPY